MNASRLQCVLDAVDRTNRQDPNRITVTDREYAREYLYSIRMTDRLHALDPQPSEILQIACRAQHIQRWKIPRRQYPMDRAGYRRWRSDLGRFHAETAVSIMRDCGYAEAECNQASNLLQKRQLKQNPQAQTLEDVACLVFLEHYLAEFALKHDEKKLLDIIRKTWIKMSGRGQEAALQIDLPPQVSLLVQSALA